MAQMRRSGVARLPRDRYDQLRSMATDRGSLAADVAAMDRFAPSPGRTAMNVLSESLHEINQEMIARGAGPGVNATHQRRMGSLMNSFPTGSHGDIAMALPRLRDPIEEFRKKSWYWIGDNFEKSLDRIREWCRLIYMTHPLVPSMIDIYSTFPLRGLHLTHEDKSLVTFHEDLFLDQLNYEEHLREMATEHWTVGEVFSLGNWHEGIGAWDADRLVPPEDVTVAPNPALSQYEFHMKIPDSIVRLVETGEPREEFEVLQRNFPHVVTWAREKRMLPVSDVLMKQVKFKGGDPWQARGTPMLMRALKTLQQEMSLEAAQDAVADRLYAPFILAKVGVEDVDAAGPWVPSAAELMAVRDDIAAALMAEFRLMVYHHALTIESVFGRENMPRLDQDFDRIDMKLMQVWGVGRELLEGGASGVPYASGALNKDLLTDMLSATQSKWKRHLRDRMLVVADRQGHYEYERAGAMRKVKTERALIEDPDGNQWIEERPVLAVPEIEFDSMDFRSDDVVNQFLASLRSMGIPIADSTFMVSVGLDFEEEVEKSLDEKQKKIAAEQELKRRVFMQIFISVLEGTPQPVPPQWVEEYASWLQQMQTVGSPMPIPDITGPAPAPNMLGPGGVPGPETGPTEEEQPGGEKDTGVKQRPAESDSKRKTQPQRRKKSAADRQAAYDAAVERVAAVHSALMDSATDDPEEVQETLKKARRRLGALRAAQTRRARKEAAVDEEAPQDEEGVETETMHYAGRPEWKPENLRYGVSAHERTRVKIRVPKSARINSADDQEAAEAAEAAEHGIAEGSKQVGASEFDSLHRFAANLPTPDAEDEEEPKEEGDGA
jgi:hypothetical protein